MLSVVPCLQDIEVLLEFGGIDRILDAVVKDCVVSKWSHLGLDVVAEGVDGDEEESCVTLEIGFLVVELFP